MRKKPTGGQNTAEDEPTTQDKKKDKKAKQVTLPPEVEAAMEAFMKSLGVENGSFMNILQLIVLTSVMDKISTEFDELETAEKDGLEGKHGKCCEDPGKERNRYPVRVPDFQVIDWLTFSFIL